MLTPPFLKKGDLVKIISTARRVTPDEMEPAIEKLTQWGFNVVCGKFLYETCHQYAGNDEQRLSDFQEALDDTNCRAILFARGGYGSLRIADKIDFSGYKKSPKWLLGFSDVTVHLIQSLNHQVECIHGPMAIYFYKGLSSESTEYIMNVLMGENIHYNFPAHALDKTGECKGELIGGNLSILHNLLGTSTDFKTAGKILFIEDLDEYYYHIDRMMIHLKRSGKLDSLAALIVGYMSQMHDNPVPFGKNAYQIILETVSEYNYPVTFGFPAGHEEVNHPLIFGRNVSLEVTRNGNCLKF
ncbi:MAG: hypothetical protein A3H98_12185 [Bacteroidetes bacterium RIFCSPLOWO2_02_FULL_36_8]|nr:MAG: hypothetical protein A3H98_12185 [Bacteroidetes bacterium RIFCSPLOWO2_02_FULL_36_8]OFY70509.1 MAG: hypothetical protein A3G23_08785 [Bacteroidetes bacterium RIFCSPLOWO2_12_FULL_37_12]